MGSGLGMALGALNVLVVAVAFALGGEGGEGAQPLRAAVEGPAGVGRDQADGRGRRDGEGQVEPGVFGDRQQQHVEDHLREADQDVLGGMHAPAGGRLEQEVGEEHRPMNIGAYFSERLTDW